jgi:hypothetical protein
VAGFNKMLSDVNQFFRSLATVGRTRHVDTVSRITALSKLRCTSDQKARCIL